MTFNTTKFTAALQAKADAFTAATPLDDMVTAAIALEKISDAVAASDVTAAAAKGVTDINGAAGLALTAIDGAKTAATGAVGTARGGALTDLEAARQKAITDVQQAGSGSAAATGVTFAPAGGIAATTVQAALVEVDSEKLAKAANLSDVASPSTALGNLGGAPLASPALTGTPTAPTAAAGTDSTQLASTAFVAAAIRALIGMAPADLDTLKEIADRLAADETTAAALASTVAGKLAKASNLSDLADVVAARSNLQLGAVALLAVITRADISDASANGRSLLGMTYAQMKAALAVAISDVAGLQAALDAKQATLSYATAADIWAGTDAGKIVTAKALRDAQVPQTLAASATPAWNAALGFNAKITLTANTTFQTPTNLVEGLTYVLRVKQDATGGRTGSYTSAFNFGADGAPTLSTAANAEDALTFLCVDAAAPRLSFVGIKKGV